MYQILDIIDVPEISVDPAALILYYSMLYHGSLTVLPETTSQVEDLTQAMYVHCLRAIPAWQKQASGTKTDVIIAILLVCPPKLVTISIKLYADAANGELLDASRLSAVWLRVQLEYIQACVALHKKTRYAQP